MSADPVAHLKTGNPEIDREHAVLIELLGQLGNVCALPVQPRAACADCASLQRQVCDTNLLGVLAGVLGFTVDHFAFEEKAMQEMAQFSAHKRDYEAHINDHERIARELRSLVVSLQSPDIIRSSIELQAIIRRWLEEHIMNFDIPFISRLDARNLQLNS